MSDLRKLYLDWPHEVSIETFAKCNASCSFCPYTTLERIGEKMPDELLDRIIEELKDHPWPFILSPFKVNEPFLDKRLMPFCRKVNDNLPNAYLRIFTNGSALTQKHIEEVAGLRQVYHLWISLNSHEPEKYKALMGLDFERTAANLDMLHAFDFPHDVVISKVAAEGREHPIQLEFMAYVNRRWPKFKVHVIKPDGWLGDIPLGADEIPDTSCTRWFELSITATGIVSHCCMDGEGKFPIGDISKQSLFEVYNSPAWRKNRLTMWSRKNVHPCSTCSY
jgi:sulfatase maturation enzyme AslB (radical SAM superfamily)